jgi:beta-phosphoglucomutase-like phosphatase (HAD superfamily)
MINAILFDLIGTTVLEKDPDMINNCFVRAFANQGIAVTDNLIKANRGKDKGEMIGLILKKLSQPLSIKDPILNSFKVNLENNLPGFVENEGLHDTIHYLKGRKIKIGVGTGLQRDIFEQIFRHLNWKRLPWDYIGIAEEMGRGRPHPDMIFDMMRKLDLTQNGFLKVGDTMADIQEGRNANVLTAAILSGTQRVKELSDEKPDFIIQSLTELKQIVEYSDSV